MGESVLKCVTMSGVRYLVKGLWTVLGMMIILVEMAHFVIVVWPQEARQQYNEL